MDTNRFFLMDGELQVKDLIPFEYMVAIVCGGKSYRELNTEVELGRKIGLSDQEIKKKNEKLC